MSDALELTIEKCNASLVREAISLLEEQGHDCADAKGKVDAMVRFQFLIFLIYLTSLAFSHLFFKTIKKICLL